MLENASIMEPPVENNKSQKLKTNFAHFVGNKVYCCDLAVRLLAQVSSEESQKVAKQAGQELLAELQKFLNGEFGFADPITPDNLRNIYQQAESTDWTNSQDVQALKDAVFKLAREN